MPHPNKHIECLRRLRSGNAQHIIYKPRQEELDPINLIHKTTKLTIKTLRWTAQFLQFPHMAEDVMEIFMNDFLAFGSTFDQCLETLDKVLQRCESSD